MEPLQELKRQAAAMSAGQRFDLLRACGQAVLPEYRFDWPQLDWWHNESFNRYLERFGEQDGMNTGRRWMLGQLRRLIATLPGATAECGVYTGAGSYLLCQANRADPLPRQHHLFDSFAGLSPPGEHDGSHWTVGDLACQLDTVRGNLAEFTALLYHPGWIPERFVDVQHESFALVHIDVDLYQPTRASIEFFYPRLNPGGVLVCDDYGFTTCPGATRAITEYLADKPEKMIALACGGGFLIKGRTTAP